MIHRGGGINPGQWATEQVVTTVAGQEHRWLGTLLYRGGELAVDLKAAQALAQAQEQTAQAVYQFTTQAITRQTEAVRQWLQTVEQAAQEEQSTVFEQASQAVRELFQHWVQQAKNWQQLAKDQIQQLNQQVVQAVEDYAQYLVQQAKEHVAAVQAAPEADFAGVMPEGLGGQLLKWADLLWQDAAALWERFRGWVAEHWNGFTGAIRSTWLWQEWVAPTFQGFGVWWNEYVQPVLDKVRSWGTAILDGIQIGLDILGLIPGLGNVFDGLNVLISLARGNYVDAMLSLAAMLPGAGIGVGASKLLAKLTGIGGGVPATAAVIATKYGDDAYELTKLHRRANQIHSVLDTVAQRKRTTAVLKTDKGIIVGSGTIDLGPAQVAKLRKGEMPAYLRGKHAEITVLEYARQHGHRPVALVTTWGICPRCREYLSAIGATLLDNKTAIWPK